MYGLIITIIINFITCTCKNSETTKTTKVKQEVCTHVYTHVYILVVCNHTLCIEEEEDGSGHSYIAGLFMLGVSYESC